MAKSSKISNIQKLHAVSSRPGEGSTIGFVVRHVAQTDGSTSVSFSLNLNTARVPDRRYSANAAAIVHDGDRVHLIFGQRKLGGEGYRSLVIIDLYGSSVHQLLRSSATMLRGAMQYAEKHRLTPMNLSDIREDVPGQTIPFVANISSAGFTAGDACMDYYYASPFSFQIAGAGGEFQAEPVIRVNLPTALMLAVYEKLAELKDSLPQEGSKEEESEEDDDDRV